MQKLTVVHYEQELYEKTQTQFVEHSCYVSYDVDHPTADSDNLQRKKSFDSSIVGKDIDAEGLGSSPLRGFFQAVLPKR